MGKVLYKQLITQEGKENKQMEKLRLKYLNGAQDEFSSCLAGQVWNDKNDYTSTEQEK